MGTLAPLTKWIPEDDLLLKNAVEAGASLESLAKGAVQFSRRFTIQELRDRWHSLLYDLETSEDASARIIEIEFQFSVSGPSKRTCDSKIKQTSSGKRKGQSVWSYYYAMRKRVGTDPCTSANHGFLMQPDSHLIEQCASGFQEQLKYQNKYQVDDHIPRSAAFNHYEHPETGYGNGYHVLPKMYMINPAAASGDSVEGEPALQKMDMNFLKPLSSSYIMKDKNDPSVSVNHNLCLEVPECDNTLDQSCYVTPPLDLPSGYGNEVNDAPHMPSISYCKDKVPMMHCNDDIKRMHSRCVGAESGSKLDVGASETRLDNSHFVSENDMGFCSSHIKSHEDDQLLIDMDADIADKPCLDDLDSLFLSSPSDADVVVIPNSDKHSVTEVLGTSLPDSASCGESNSLPGGLNFGHDNDVSCSSSAVIFPSISPKTSFSTNLLDGYLVCSLNTEDLEIPCNDHVLLLPLCSLDACHGNKENHDTGSCAVGSPLDQKIIVGEVTIGKDEQVSHLCHMPNGHKMDLELFRNDCSAEVTGQVDTAVHEPNPCTSATPHLQSKVTFAIKEESITLDSWNHEAPVYNALQESANKEEKFSDSEADIPYFADIEAMILDMDLDLYEQGSCPVTMEASRYQSMDFKKVVVRLEQGARSFVNRAISSHGALAIFYGRHLKYFIRNPEVSIGRATQDVKVDIDLGLEGRANKVSRRQAMIKMDKDGSFFLKNTGKYSVYVNGKEVAARSCIHLNSGSLIEVRSMTFMFEVNQSAVRQFLTKIDAVAARH